jgi:lipopolysaccharide transport system ATP-binding protein
MSSSVIEISNLSKRYRIGVKQNYYALRDSIAQFITQPFSLFKRDSGNDFWALKDISFSVKKGEIIGLIGTNGAGKSTLLKVLSRITPPTAGEVKLTGRVGSLLEVGTGFHPELTGRENIFLNGSILGMRGTEVKARFNEIVEFAGIEKFLDTPMKHYSSGMYTRLAFSVAAHLSSEILLVDEVLAVGDVEFQKKCLGKMDAIAKSGRTIIFVSHNLGALQQLCTKAVFLEQGRMKYVGNVDTAIVKYLASIETQNKIPLLKRNRAEGLTLTAKVSAVEITDAKGKEIKFIDSTQACQIHIQVQATKQVQTGVGLTIRDENGRNVLFISSGHIQNKLFSFKKGKTSITCKLEPTHLTSGRYSIDCTLSAPNREIVDRVADALIINVKPYDPYQIGFDFSQKYGAVNVNHTWQIKSHA